MSVTTNQSPDGDQITIAINGRFDFGAHEGFRRAYERSADDVTAYVVDLGGADYMDSSALGMLLMLREFAGGDRSKVRITNAREAIRNVLTIANFDRLFEVD